MNYIQKIKRDKGQHNLRLASYTLSKEEKDSIFDYMNSIDVCLDILLFLKYKGNINMKEKRFKKSKGP
jgi:hypothetical protein